MGSSINNQECYQVFLNLVKHELLVYCDLFLELSLLVLFKFIQLLILLTYLFSVIYSLFFMISSFLILIKKNLDLSFQ